LEFEQRVSVDTLQFSIFLKTFGGKIKKKLNNNIKPINKLETKKNFLSGPEIVRHSEKQKSALVRLKKEISETQPGGHY
jgi:hypothetical protein